MSHQATLGGRQLTFEKIKVAHALEEVIYWVPPSQLQGTCDSTFESHDVQDNHLPCIVDVTSDLDYFFLTDECYDLIFETERLDIVRVNFVRDYHEVCFDMSYLCASNDLKTDFVITE